jgi:hypothetical protein
LAHLYEGLCGGKGGVLALDKALTDDLELWNSQAIITKTIIGRKIISQTIISQTIIGQTIIGQTIIGH